MCGSQVTSDVDPVSISCGYRVSCAKTLRVDRVSRQAGGASWRDQRAPAARLIFSPCLNDLPEKYIISELFAGFSRHV